MAATNSTTNLGLPQWEETDKILRTDLNTAFATLDEGTGSGITVVDTYPTEEDGEDGDVYAVKNISGTWTPVIKVGGSTTGVSYPAASTRYGSYWIFGNLLFFIAEVGFVVSGVSGDITLEGFPVATSSSRPYSAFPIAQHQFDFPSGAVGAFVLMPGESTVGSLRFSKDDAAWINLTTSHLSSTWDSFFRVQGFYQID